MLIDTITDNLWKQNWLLTQNVEFDKIEYVDIYRLTSHGMISTIDENICNAVNNNIGYKFVALYMKLIEINSYACIVTKCLGNKFTSFKLLNPLPILKHSFTQTIDP